MKLEFSRQIFEKYSSIKLRENSFNGSPVVPCGRTDVTRLTVDFRNIVDAPKNQSDFLYRLLPGYRHMQCRFHVGSVTPLRLCHLTYWGLMGLVLLAVLAPLNTTPWFFDINALKTKRRLLYLTLRRRIKSHLLFAGIIRSSPFSPR